MAVAGYSSITMKAVVLVLVLVCMAMAVVPSVSASPATENPTQFSDTPLGRKLLAINLCGSGTAPNFNCARLLPRANRPVCCSDALGLTQSCFDVGAGLLTRCGSCNTRCAFGQICCRGVCANLTNDPNNCGVCGRRCPANLPCFFGLCKYGY